jgi:enolase
MSRIESIHIRKIIDSRGNPTVEVEVRTPDGFGSAAAPSGASTGVHEVQAFPAQGVDFAVEQFRGEFAGKLLGMDVRFQRRFDNELKELDGTANFSKMGGNVAVASSLAFAKAAAATYKVPLFLYLGGAFAGYGVPYPMGNVLGGGRHAIGGTDIQEYLVISFGQTVSDCVFGNALVHKKLKTALVKKFPNSAIGKGDEGAWVARLGNEEALALVADCCKEASGELGFPVQPSLDIAASELYKKGFYHYKERKLNPAKQIDFVEKLIKTYKLYSVEDPLDQDDFAGYSELTERVGSNCLIIKKGVDMGACNTVLIKPNQVGTLSDTFDSISLAHQHGYKTVISHRSGETEDTSIAHLGVAFGCHAIKTGVVGSERTSKLNELIRIQEKVRSHTVSISGRE